MVLSKELVVAVEDFIAKTKSARKKNPDIVAKDAIRFPHLESLLERGLYVANSVLVQNKKTGVVDDALFSELDDINNILLKASECLHFLDNIPKLVVEYLGVKKDVEV
jgi:hypothetical protein